MHCKPCCNYSQEYVSHAGICTNRVNVRCFCVSVWPLSMNLSHVFRIWNVRCHQSFLNFLFCFVSVEKIGLGRRAIIFCCIPNEHTIVWDLFVCASCCIVDDTIHWSDNNLNACPFLPIPCTRVRKIFDRVCQQDKGSPSLSTNVFDQSLSFECNCWIQFRINTHWLNEVSIS